MRLSQSASISSPKGGNGNRLGKRTRKKHKKLDAITEDVFNENRRVKVESNERSGSSKGGDDSELRRSSRVRRAPVILDASPPPPRKRRKKDKLGKRTRGGSVEKSSRGKGKGKGKVECEDSSSSSEDSSKEESGAWKSRLRSRGKSDLKGSGNRPRGKRKLFMGLDDDEDDDDDEVKSMKNYLEEDDDDEVKSMKNDLEEDVQCSDGDKSRVVKSTCSDRVRTLSDHEDERGDDPSGDESLENGVDELRNEGSGDSPPSEREKDDANEDNSDGNPVCQLEKKSEAPIGISVLENQNMSDNVKECEQNDEPLCSSKIIGDVDNERHLVEVAVRPTDQEEDEGRDVAHNVSEAEVNHEKETKVTPCSVTVGEIHKSRIKEGRRCGLCGGGTDGKPPKRLANDSTGSDHEAYSGSSASEEFTYDAWDGFGDEAGWLGRLLGPINDRYGIAGIWVHQQCAVWSPEVYFAGLGCLKNVRAALCRGRALKCTRCGRPGATLGCRVDRCPKTYHLPCARASGCAFDHRKFLIACADHRYLFQPHGPQYLERIKKLKAKKMKLEMRKVSNDASRKDLEAEEKWMEKCGEDEEFLRRETKRLQRDLLRIAPVYIGGCQSDGENLFEGWESVAGLQDVIRCMKEVVILPLLYPEFFENMGITPPRGVLLHGYPGTGKTLVVRALIGACARGDKRIAYFARKGADCLGKYVGDAERQLRLLFQVAEKSQPSIIFFDEIDGLAPVRTRQQDQTHSSVVSTLLALMDGLKSRGSVIVIGATNRPDSVDPALRRPGRFDREIYFPLPSVKDRAAILALHTRKWPKPVAGPLLEWVANKTVGFAGADLQALCAQAAVIALKRSCSWQKILSSAENNNVEGKRLQLPAFAVEERDWLEALSLAPPPCSRREAGMAANEVLSSPLHIHLVPCLLQPLLNLIILLYLDDRLWLPRRLMNAGESIKRSLISFTERRHLPSDRWWCYASSMAQESDTAGEMVRNLLTAGILDGDSSFTGRELLNDTSSGDSRFPCRVDVNTSGVFKNLCHGQSKKKGYRILITGDARSGQKHLASCLLHCFMGSIDVQKIDMATISQEGQGDMEQGISHILMKCASMKLCVIFMPRIDLWAIESVPRMSEASSTSDGCCNRASPASSQIDGEEQSSVPSASELMEIEESQNELSNASQTWKSFVEQLECICVSSSLIILATSELPCAALPYDVRQFFGSDSLASEGSVISEHATPRFSVEVDGEFDHDMLIHSSALDLSRDLIQQYVHLVHQKNHVHSLSSITAEAHSQGERDALNQNIARKSAEEPGAKTQFPEGSLTKIPVPSGSRNGKGKSSLVLAISSFGYQILRYPHFGELCWVTSKLKEGPSADIRGPWKGWPFNSCVVRPCKSTQNETVACSSNTIKGKDKFTLVRGLVAVGLSAYRGTYTSPKEVSLEVRKVLQLLVLQIGARIKSGKDRYQFMRLLSQVAYLEDMVNNWAHTLRSLEPDAQTRMMEPKLTGGQSAENHQTPTDHPVQAEEQPNNQDGGLREPELVDGGLQGSIPESSVPANLIATDVRGDNLNELPNLNETPSEKVESPDHIAAEICYPEDGENQDKGSPEQDMVLASNHVSSTHFDQSLNPISDEKITGCEELESKQSAIMGEEMLCTQQGSEFACRESFDQPMAGAGNSDEPNAAGVCQSDDVCNQSTTIVVDNESPAEAAKNTCDTHLPESKCPESGDLSSEPVAICSYSCCTGCVSNLHLLVKNIVSQEWNVSRSCSTVEDIHDLVSSLSTSLCSAVRRFYVSQGSSSSLNGQLRLESYRKLFDSQDKDACQCESSENRFTRLLECACHPRRELNLPFGDHLGFVPRYIFRDGVLISAEPDDSFSLHCKYDTLCLCSLIEFLAITKKPSD